MRTQQSELLRHYINPKKKKKKKPKEIDKIYMPPEKRQQIIDDLRLS